MGGAYMKLKILGSQDQYLTTNGDLNFFIKEYKNFVNFSIDRQKIYFTEDVNFGKKISITMPRTGDLLYKMYFCFELPALIKTSGSYCSYTNSIAFSIIDYIDLEIGNQLVSRHYGLFLEIWEELTADNQYENASIGKTSTISILENMSEYSSYYITPMPFWFCKHIHVAFPLLALTYNQIKVSIKLKQFDECILYNGSTPPTTTRISDAYMLADYIFVDELTKARIRGNTKQILIEQLQYKNTQGSDINGDIFKTNIPFNHPIKDLLWVFIENRSIQNNDWFNFAQRNIIPLTKVFPLMKTAKLTIDGTDYTDYMKEIEYRNINTFRNRTDRFIYTLSFCKNSEEWQPSGSLNFSKIDSADILGQMQPGATTSTMHIFGINYNWLYIENGMSNVMYIT